MNSPESLATFFHKNLGCELKSITAKQLHNRICAALKAKLDKQTVTVVVRAEKVQTKQTSAPVALLATKPVVKMHDPGKQTKSVPSKRKVEHLNDTKQPKKRMCSVELTEEFEREIEDFVSNNRPKALTAEEALDVLLLQAHFRHEHEAAVTKQAAAVQPIESNIASPNFGKEVAEILCRTASTVTEIWDDFVKNVKKQTPPLKMTDALIHEIVTYVKRNRPRALTKVEKLDTLLLQVYLRRQHEAAHKPKSHRRAKLRDVTDYSKQVAIMLRRKKSLVRQVWKEYNTNKNITVSALPGNRLPKKTFVPRTPRTLSVIEQLIRDRKAMGNRTVAKDILDCLIKKRIVKLKDEKQKAYSSAVRSVQRYCERSDFNRTKSGYSLPTK
jgi:hypothetical protein